MFQLLKMCIRSFALLVEEKNLQTAQYRQKPISTEVRQVTELPEIQAEITQFNIHTCSCASCGEWVKAEVPPEALSAFGPRLKGFISSLTGDLGVTKRKVVNLVGYLNIKISVGSVCGIHHLAGKILEKPCEDIKKKVLSQPSLHSDETSWYHKGKRQWLWVLTGDKGAYFKIHPSRSSAAFQSILGSSPQNQPLTTDRYSAYNSYEGPRQHCWSQRKLSYGTQSDAGCSFMERILTVAVTFKKQSKNVFDYLTSCFEAHSRDAPIPSPL